MGDRKRPPQVVGMAGALQSDLVPAHGADLITLTFVTSGENLGVADTDKTELAGLGHDTLLREWNRMIAVFHQAHRPFCIGSILQL
jgi:hypothetical protein